MDSSRSQLIAKLVLCLPHLGAVAIFMEILYDSENGYVIEISEEDRYKVGPAEGTVYAIRSRNSAFTGLSENRFPDLKSLQQVLEAALIRNTGEDCFVDDLRSLFGESAP